MKILIIDDDPDILMITQVTLEKLGNHEVVPVKPDGDILGRIENEMPDVILMDFSMYDLDGLSVMKRLRAEERLRRIPVIFFTASADAAHRKQFLTLGAKGVIKKPFDPSTLSEEIDRILAE